MGCPSRSGPAGRPISAPLRSQAAPRPGGTCSRPAARFHLPPGATARVASSLIKLVSAAPGGTCPRPAARLLLPPGATARVASSLIEPVPAAPGGTCPPARGPLLPATGRYGPRGASALQAGARSTWGDVPPRIAARPYLPPSTTARVEPSPFKAGARIAWGNVSPGSRPASTRYRALRPAAWRLHSSSRAVGAPYGGPPPVCVAGGRDQEVTARHIT